MLSEAKHLTHNSVCETLLFAQDDLGHYNASHRDDAIA